MQIDLINYGVLHEPCMGNECNKHMIYLRNSIKRKETVQSTNYEQFLPNYKRTK